MGKKSSLLASSKAIDPHLEALFASSSGPVSAPSKSIYQQRRGKKPKSASDDKDGDDQVLSDASQELDYDDDEDDDDDDGKPSSDDHVQKDQSDGDSSDGKEPEEAVEPRRERKRKRKDDNEHLEQQYLADLAKEDGEKEPSGKRVKSAKPDQDSGSDSDDHDHDDKEALPTHESLSKETAAAEAAKAARTVFVANVAIEAVSSKAAKKTLLAHLASALDADDRPVQKMESIRFRSVAFSTGSMPKRAAYITKSVMEATTRSTNAYVVFSTAAAARRVCQRLNGTEVLARHIRVDSVAHPSPTDNRRCVFVGNLGFVDDETVLATNKGGDAKETRKRNKVPADVEEGLWRTFSAHGGKVENVRVVRDPKTRVGKGFAYVQFYDANAVEEALLLDGKSFPPMLPRKLRVTRAKDPRKTAQAVERAKAKLSQRQHGGKSIFRRRDKGAAATAAASTYVPKMTPEQQTAAGRAGKLFGRTRGSNGNGTGNDNGTGLPAGVKAPQRIVFEGRRASARDALPKDLKPRKKSKAAKPSVRPAAKSAHGGGADWKKKKSDE